MGFKKLKPYVGARHKGCLKCGSVPEKLEMSRPLAVGFGSVTVTKGEVGIWSGDDETVTVDRIEKMAKEDPGHDWRIEFQAPLYDAVFQRQGEAEWILVKKGDGFA